MKISCQRNLFDKDIIIFELKTNLEKEVLRYTNVQKIENLTEGENDLALLKLENQNLKK